MRTLRMPPVLFVLLVVTFGLFLAYTFGFPGPGPITDAAGATITVITDVSSPPDMPTLPILPVLAIGWPMLILAFACGLLTFLTVTITVTVNAFLPRNLKPGRG